MRVPHLTGVAVAVIALALAGGANAQNTVIEETYIQPKNIEGSKSIDFRMFDVNKDGFYSREEVGEHLFYMFDQDGNHTIDNHEWEKRVVYTIVPLEKETFRFIDHGSTGEIDEVDYDYEVFYEETGLSRFDKSGMGLSAKEFIGGKSFLQMDTNRSGVIELDEWKRAYEESTRPKVAEQWRYND